MHNSCAYMSVCEHVMYACMSKSHDHACFTPSCSVNSCTDTCVFTLRRVLSHQSDILKRQHLCVCEYGLWLELVKHVSVTFENSDVLSSGKSRLIGPVAQTDYWKLPWQELISPLRLFRPPLLLGRSLSKKQCEWMQYSHLLNTAVDIHLFIYLLKIFFTFTLS